MDGDKRPISVLTFEVLGIASVLFDMALTDTGSDPFLHLFTSGLLLALTLWITRGRSNPARIIYTSIMVFGTAALIGTYALGYISGEPRFWLLQTLLWPVVFLALLWWPLTSNWLNGRQREVAP